MQDFELVCKHVGKLIIDASIEAEKLSKKFHAALEEFRTTIAEKDTRIKLLEKELESLRSKK